MTASLHASLFDALVAIGGERTIWYFVSTLIGLALVIWTVATNRNYRLAICVVSFYPALLYVVLGIAILVDTVTQGMSLQPVLLMHHVEFGFSAATFGYFVFTRGLTPSPGKVRFDRIAVIAVSAWQAVMGIIFVAFSAR
jgi:hypothetical protein